MRWFSSFLPAILILLAAPSAYAVCSSPSASAGKIIYNTAYHVPQYCDGTNWIKMGRLGLDDGLVGWWKFNDGSGTTAVDSSSGGHNGTLTNGPTWTTGRIGGGISLDGVNDYVNVGNFLNQTTASFSYGIWGKYTATTGNVPGLLARVVTDSATGYSILSATTTSKVMAKINDGTNSLQLLSLTTMNDGSWHHYFATVDRSAKVMTFYVDGAVHATGSTASIGSLTNTTNFVFGVRRDNTGYINFFPGSLDDARVYSRVLSAAEVYRLYQDGAGTSQCTSSTEGKIRYNVNRRTLEYCNSSAWIGMARVYSAWGVVFDGTNDYLTYSTSMGADAKTATGSFWFRRNGGNGSQQVLFCAIDSAGSCRFQASLNTSNQLRLLGKDTAGTTILNVAGSSAITDTNWHHAMFSFDLSDSTKRSIYIDGTAETPTWTTYTNSNIDFTRTSYSVGAFTDGTSKYNGDLADFYLDMGTYTGLGTAVNREKFRNAGGKPVDLGYNGSTPSGTQPEIYLSGGTLSSWNTNKGSGGGFTVTGTLTEATGTQGEGGIRRGLVGHWKFDEGSGTSAADSSGQGNTGTLTNGPAWTTGQWGGALSFDGSDDYVETSKQPGQLISSSTGTISAWVKPTGASPSTGNAYQGRAAIFDYASGTVGMLRASIGGADRIWMYNWDGNEDRVGVTYNIDEWVHLVWVHSGGTLYAYKNGASAGSTASGDTWILTGTIGIGNSYTGGGGSADWEGEIDDVRVYNRALSAADVAALYANAVCASPAKAEGAILFNTDNNVLQYCDGLSWRAIGK